MNKAAIMILLALAAVPSFGQERTLISGPVAHGGFGGPQLMLGQVKGETAVLMGGWHWLDLPSRIVAHQTILKSVQPMWGLRRLGCESGC